MRRQAYNKLTTATAKARRPTQERYIKRHPGLRGEADLYIRQVRPGSRHPLTGLADAI